MKYFIDIGIPIIVVTLSAYFSYVEIKAKFLSRKFKMEIPKIIYVIHFLKYLILHIVAVILPFFIIALTNKASQDIFNEWYLSHSTRIISASIGYVLILLPIFMLIPKTNKWIRVYYVLLGLFFCALALIILVP